MLISLYHFVPFVLHIIVPKILEHVLESTAYVIIIPSTVLTVTILYNGILYFIYTKKIPFFEQYRVNAKVKLSLCLETLAVVIESLKMVQWLSLEKYQSNLLWYLHSYSFLAILKFSSLVLIYYGHEQANPLKDFAVQIIIMLFLEDLIYFMTHKALHSPAFYKYHKKHH